MSEDFEVLLTQREARGARGAERILKQHLVRQPYPRRDQHNVSRLGWFRAIERVPESEPASDFKLRSDLQRVRSELHGRVFALTARINLSDEKLAAVYVMADLLGVDHVHNWEPLWAALEREDSASIAYELTLCNWTKLVGSTEELKRLFARVLAILVTDLVADVSA